jgi:hypothetical protein
MEEGNIEEKKAAEKGEKAKRAEGTDRALAEPIS